MSQRSLPAGGTSQIVQVFLQDSSSSTGAGLTGLAFGTAGLTCYYKRNKDAAAVAVTLADMTPGTYTSGGFKQVSAANAPGLYDFCPPDAALADLSESVTFFFRGATNLADTPVLFDLVGPNNALPVNVVQWQGETVGALSFGYLQVDLRLIRGTLVSESSPGNLAFAFRHFFDVASPALTVASVNQTADAAAVPALVWAVNVPGSYILPQAGYRLGLISGPITVGTGTSGTFAGAQSNYVSPSEVVLRCDWRYFADLCSDDGTRLTNSAAVVASANFAALVTDANGMLEAFALAGQRYSAADLSTLAGNTGPAHGLLCRVVADLTIYLAAERRPELRDHAPHCYERAEEWIRRLGEGEAIFPFTATAEAGRLDHTIITGTEVGDRDLTTVQVQGYLGRRADRSDPANP